MATYPNLVQFQKLPPYLQQINAIQFVKQVDQDISIQISDWDDTVVDYDILFSFGAPGLTSPNPSINDASPLGLVTVGSKTDGASVTVQLANGLPQYWPMGAWAYWTVTIAATLEDGNTQVKGVWLKVAG